MNKRLRELGEKWTFTAPASVPPSVIMQQAEQPKAVLEFSFYNPDSDEYPLRTITAEAQNVMVRVKVTFRVLGNTTAKNGKVWFRICRECRFAEEPVGFEPPQKDSPQDRRMGFVAVLPGPIHDPIELAIFPPLFPRVGQIRIASYYACENCL
jgi:hypothetical protein